MPEALFPLPYFGPLSIYAALVKYEHILVEATENYQKQSYRNRQYIFGANGKLMLNIPVKRSSSGQRLTYKDSKIENEFKWQNLHFKSLETAYRTSPYFEFYEAEFEPLYHQNFSSLFEFNLLCFKTVIELIGIEVKLEMTEVYQKEYKTLPDYRGLINAKTQKNTIHRPYHQVFEEKYGFIPDLSILDLLFNLGPESLSYLKSTSLSQP